MQSKIRLFFDHWLIFVRKERYQSLSVMNGIISLIERISFREKMSNSLLKDDGNVMRISFQNRTSSLFQSTQMIDRINHKMNLNSLQMFAIIAILFFGQPSILSLCRCDSKSFLSIDWRQLIISILLEHSFLIESIYELSNSKRIYW